MPWRSTPGHGYIISSFLSPASNRRTDRYGGTLENRARLLVEVIQAIKRAAGADYPVWFRLDSQEYLKHDGITARGCDRQPRNWREAAGADAVHVTAYADASRGISFTEAHTVHEPCNYVPNAAAIKAAVSVPVIGVGRIEPEVADRLIAEGKLDFRGDGAQAARRSGAAGELGAGPRRSRPALHLLLHVHQPDLLRQARALCRQSADRLRGSMRPSSSAPAAEPQRVLVVGGGPGGMEAARVARLRGHEVHLHEAVGRLGGTVFFSSIVYPENGRLIDYLARADAELGVRVRLKSRVTRGFREQRLQPDVDRRRHGRERGRSELPGAELAARVQRRRDARDGHRADRARACDASCRRIRAACSRAGKAAAACSTAARRIRRLSEHYLPLGEHVVIYGGGLVGVELAEFLAERHRQRHAHRAGPDVRQGAA